MDCTWTLSCTYGLYCGNHEIFTLLNNLPFQLVLVNTSHARFLNGTIRELTDEDALGLYTEEEAGELLFKNSRLSKEQSRYEVNQVCLPIESLYSGANVFHEIIMKITRLPLREIEKTKLQKME